MKAGILTFHDADNYGALLQAYALQQTLKKLGIENEFIAIEREQKPVVLSEEKGAMAVFRRRILEAGESRKKRFAEFREHFLEISPVYSRAEAEQLNEKYAFFIAGSDQVWNFKIPDVDPRYFLPFAANEKKYSYAASFGSEKLPESLIGWCKKQLETFRRISIREESGKKLLFDLTGMEAQVHADPTLLLERKDWEQISEKWESQYLLLFLLVYDEEAVCRARKLASDLGVELRTVTAGFIPQLGMDAWCKTGVEDWISLVRNAQAVVTNSFHGIVFSILFEKKFEFIELKGALSARNGRIRELLSKTGLTEERNYERASQIIEKMREEALAYLREVGQENGFIS